MAAQLRESVNPHRTVNTIILYKGLITNKRWHKWLHGLASQTNTIKIALVIFCYYDWINLACTTHEVGNKNLELPNFIMLLTIMSEEKKALLFFPRIHYRREK